MTTSEAPDEEDLYAVLGVTRTADEVALRKAYRALALQLHPDKNVGNPAATRFKRVTRAYNVLADPDKRRYYDTEGTLEDIDVAAEDWMAMFAQTMQELTGGMPIKVGTLQNTTWRSCHLACNMYTATAHRHRMRS
jgi:curved DNA-binding protein CbpA